MAALGLPVVPPELKPIVPYLQRAEEVKAQEPVVAYWCAYYAAQIGISMKAKGPAASHFLLQLLDTLENMKKEIGPNDAIDEDSVGSAYVENFALKVFARADNEDRNGKATRATAKKFLAAANFFEVLSVFSSSSSEPSSAMESTTAEKIRYAKWKAADIAKAIREGRKPTPGPAAAVEDLPPPQPAPQTQPDLPPTPSTPPQHSVHIRNSSESPPSIIRNTPPPPNLGNLSTANSQGSPAHSQHLLPGGFTKADPKSPGSWSTAATPGTPGFPGTPGVFVTDEPEYDAAEGAVLPSVPPSGVIGTSNSPALPSGGDPRKVHFSPSVADGSSLPSTPNARDDAPDLQVTISLPDQTTPILPSAPPAPPSLPPGFVPTSVEPDLRGVPHALPSVPPLQPPVQSHANVPPQHPVDTSIVTTVPIQLTPRLVTQTQKHCRYAISALDYEDVETARKELRAALQLLGG
ncbi:DUF605-domain-containing protein [Panus rudis PR-1116 ss-1]|nr:DUF605-domain-containing protein [Panus rudis PR-1116 ss-1]